MWAPPKRIMGTRDILSDSTIEKKIAATQSEVRDVVTSGIHMDRVEEVLDLIRASMTKEIFLGQVCKLHAGKA